jgi:hypothetical protein
VYRWDVVLSKRQRGRAGRPRAGNARAWRWPGGQNTSWNAAHMSQGCTKQAFINTGGAGKLYCFAIN